MLKEKIETRDLVKTISIIKKDIISTRNKIIHHSNKELINLCFRIGKIISEKTSYGKNFVGLLSKSLKLNFPDSSGFSERNLWRTKTFYEKYKKFSILPPAVAELSWTHIR